MAGERDKNTCEFYEGCVMHRGMGRQFPLWAKPDCTKYCMGYIPDRGDKCPVYATNAEYLKILAQGIEGLTDKISRGADRLAEKIDDLTAELEERGPTRASD
ncbi:TPA: hypothetical protein HA265_07040 [Candidatus Woesearchaeota archaeon]|nr:hypothetical protein [Candidatus Woesearchaeota archaeon]